MKSIKILIVVLIIAGVSAGAYFFYSQKNFEVVHPKRGNITEAIYGLGKVKSHKRFEIVLGVMTTVQKLFVDEGTDVKAGDPLIKLESGTVRAPFSGTVTLVRQREGETALPQIPLLRIEDISDRYIELSLEQQAALRIRKGQNARISFETLRNKILTGKVSSIFPKEDEFLAHIQVPGMEVNVLPGMTADVTIEIGTIQDAILIPLSSVSNGMVTVKRKNKWVKEKINIGHVDGLNVQVLGDQLEETDLLRVQKED